MSIRLPETPMRSFTAERGGCRAIGTHLLKIPLSWTKIAIFSFLELVLRTRQKLARQRIHKFGDFWKSFIEL